MTARRAPSRSWPLTMLIVGMPLWWVLGMGSFIWIIFSFPMGFVLLRRTPIRAPKGFGIFLVFLGFVLASVSQAEGLRFISVGFRLVLYLATAVVFLYVYNLSEQELPRERVLKLAVVYLMYAVAGGYFALALGDYGFTSATEMVLPGAVSANQWAVDLVHPVFAQEQDFLGFPLARPTAPFVFTNEWGSGMALLTPFAIAAYAGLDRRWRSIIVFTGFFALVPVVMSVNRGLWLALMVGVGYGSVMLAVRGDTRYFKAMLVGAAAVGLVVALTPLGGLIGERLNNGHSDEGRLFLYGQVIDQIQDSPWVGYGAPRVNEERPGLPSVGTHGQFWTVLFSHGIPGTLAFVAFTVHLSWKTIRRQDRVGVWLHVTVALVPILMWFYELINQPIFLMFVAGGLALRGVPEHAELPRSQGQGIEPGPSHPPVLVPTGKRPPARI